MEHSDGGFWSLEVSVQSHNERIELLGQQQLRVDELLY